MKTKMKQKDIRENQLSQKLGIWEKSNGIDKPEASLIKQMKNKKSEL